MNIAPPREVRIRRTGQIALGAIWLLDGVLQLQPVMFGKAFVTGVILPNSAGQPAFVGSLVTWIGHQIEPHVALFNALAASLELLIGLGLLSKRTVKPALAASLVWALAIWVVGEGFGGILTGTADPLTGAPGAALLYVVVSATVWPRRTGRLPAERVAWSALWLLSAGLWLLQANHSPNSVHDAIASVPSGAAWLSDTLRAVANAAAGHGTAIAVVMAALSAAIAVSALTRVAERGFLAVGVAVSGLYWVVGQGLGGIFTGSATDVSTAPLVVVMACLTLAQAPARRSAGVSSAGFRHAAITAN